jgi:hypothetical protein
MSPLPSSAGPVCGPVPVGGSSQGLSGCGSDCLVGEVVDALLRPVVDG